MSVNLYSIGYATKPLTKFMAQLQGFEMDVVADVRLGTLQRRLS